MKFKLLAMILALTVVSYAQTATQTAPSTAPAQSKQDEAKPSDAKAGCSCCKKMMEGKEGSCCEHHDMAAKDGKGAMACCAGKDQKSCMGKEGCCGMKADKDKSAAMCSDGMCCGKGKDGDKKMAMACCGGAQCGTGNHEHAEEMK
ncbi:MAG TPA: hypothetical protein VFA68_00760 [Terriglobales bacterium]|nr:hypothetical protein [Terriglobales bacterium]